MEKIGIICEYNPFHNGHLYHIQKIKELYPDSIIILCLNGYFLERGDISLLNKESKTKIALNHGVDLVVELPLYYGVQSSDYFAYGAISILNALGVQKIIFGSEKNNIEYLEKIVLKQQNMTLKSDIKNLNYPAKLQMALNEEKINPNDLLGISYLKNIKKINPLIKAETIKRTNNFLDISEDTDIVSAQNIRHKIKMKQDIKRYVPKDIIKNINVINEELLYTIITAKVLTDNHLNEYLDVVEGLENKLKKEILKNNNFNDLILKIKSKRYTYAKLKRMLIHIILGIKKDEKISITYIHILGFNKKGENYLKTNRNNILLPTKVDKTSRLYELEIIGAKIYDLITNTESSTFDIKSAPLQK